MENLNELFSTLNQYINYLMADKHVSLYEMVISILGTILPSVVAIITVICSTRMSKADYRRNIREKEYEKYSKALEEFYYPFMYLLGLNTAVYSCFALNEKKENSDFRTLIALIEKYSFSDTDKKVLGKIISINSKINKLIFEKGLYVENPHVREKLIQLSTHYTIIDLAYNGKIDEQHKEYEKMVFPTEIHECVSSEIKRIEDKLAELR